MPRSSWPSPRLAIDTSVRPARQRDRLSGHRVLTSEDTMQHGKIYDNITELIGNTPMVRLQRVLSGGAEVVVKLEAFHPLSSVKDRISISMVEDAEKRGEIKPGKNTVVEGTSGNTGIGLAFVAAAKGYRCILVMPDTFSVERRKL